MKFVRKVIPFTLVFGFAACSDTEKDYSGSLGTCTIKDADATLVFCSEFSFTAKDDADPTNDAAAVAETACKTTGASDPMTYTYARTGTCATTGTSVVGSCTYIDKTNTKATVTTKTVLSGASMTSATATSYCTGLSGTYTAISSSNAFGATDAAPVTFTTACQASDNSTADSPEYTTGTLTVNATTMSGTMNFFSDSTCTTASYSLVGSETFVIGGAASVSGATKIDRTASSVVITPKSDAMVEFFNSSSFCGKTDWAASTAADVTTATCGASANNSTLYDIFKIDGSSLQFGESGSGSSTDGSTDAKRHAALSVVVEKK